MRENYTWATDCGPVVGEIKNGKRYPNGAVPAEDYAKDMAAVNTAIENLRRAVTEINGAENVLETKLNALVTDYNGAVPGLVTDTTNLKVKTAEMQTALQAVAAGNAQLQTKTNQLTDSINALIADFTVIRNNVTDLQSNKVDKISGKGLSANDYSDSEKTKVSNATSDIAVLKSYFTLT